MTSSAGASISAIVESSMSCPRPVPSSLPSPDFAQESSFEVSPDFQLTSLVNAAVSATPVSNAAPTLPSPTRRFSS